MIQRQTYLEIDLLVATDYFPPFGLIYMRMSKVVAFGTGNKYYIGQKQRGGIFWVEISVTVWDAIEDSIDRKWDRCNEYRKQRFDLH